MNKQNRKTCFLAGCVLAASLLGCNHFDSLAEKFDKVAIGDSTPMVIETLGPAESKYSVEGPLFKIDQMAWRSQASGRVYTVIAVFDRVAAKSIL
jgi:hypothetical protein